jgi:hypothetical protein
MSIYIDTAWTSTRIAEELATTLGRRRAMWIRTRLSQLAEDEDGRRQGRRGRDRVRPVRSNVRVIDGRLAGAAD